MELRRLAALTCLFLAWSPTALAQWDGGMLTLWQRADQAHPNVDEIVIIPVDSATWQTTAPYILCRRSDGTCVDTWDPSADVLVIDAPVLEDNAGDLVAYRSKLRQVLDLTEDPSTFPVLPQILVTDLAGSPPLLTSDDFQSIDTYQQVTDTEVAWSDSSVRPETQLP